MHFTAEETSDGVRSLMGHGGGLHKKTPALVARAHDTVTIWGHTVVAIDAPGHGDRPRTEEDEQARADLREAMAAGDIRRFESVSVRYATSLAERAVPQWRATLDALQTLGACRSATAAASRRWDRRTRNPAPGARPRGVGRVGQRVTAG
jgi:hypothetical protein